MRGGCGFSFGNGCSGGTSEGSLFGSKPRGNAQQVVFMEVQRDKVTS
jgi:nitrate reductase beta subunit